MGFCSVDVLLSPKSQFQLVGLLVDVSLNCTDKVPVPLVTLLVKLAVGGSAALTAPAARRQKSRAKTMSKIVVFLFFNIRSSYYFFNLEQIYFNEVRCSFMVCGSNKTVKIFFPL
ncbi:hypothetical protein DSECCO2_547620 [anaerobic digester metagenome]